jgi:CheY-like chemotaxis protein
MKVLVVDPDLRRAPALKDTLAAGGAEVTIASSGSFALTMLEWNRHDVVVSRARIDDMDGHELCAILKADPGTREVRFVLVASADEVTGAETAAAGVDLVLPPSMTSGAILPLIVRLMQANRATGSEAPSMSAPAPAATSAAAPPVIASPVVSTAPPASVPVARETAPASTEAGVPRIKPAAAPPPAADPPKRYATMVTAGPDGPWANTAPSAPAPAAPAKTTPPAAAPRLSPPASSPSAPPMRVAVPTAPRSTPSPVRGATPASTRAGTPTRPASAAAGRSAPPAPGRPAAPAPPRAAAPPPARPATTPSVPDLASIPSGTFQGSLEVMELADLTQAISAGGKTGRLILALPQGGGLMLYDKGRIVHAEYRNAVGEEAFGALLAASHADGAGRFCFLPSPAGDSTGLPRTIDKSVDQLLLSSATAIDEKG